MTAPDTRLVLIRHGESDAQDRGYVSGHDVCGGLSDAGREQAGGSATGCTRPASSARSTCLYTSILARAIETAKILAPALGKVPPQRECDWCEIHPGEARD